MGLRDKSNDAAIHESYRSSAQEESLDAVKDQCNNNIKLSYLTLEWICRAEI